MTSSIADLGHSSFVQTVMFNEQQSFRRAHTSLDLALVQHASSTMKVLEIIAFDPMLREEAPRLYLRMDALEQQLMAQAASSFQEPDQCVALGTESLRKLVIEYVLTRINLTSTSHSNADKLLHLSEHTDHSWKVTLVPHFNDIKDSATGHLAVLCDKPEGLMPAVVDRTARYAPRCSHRSLPAPSHSSDHVAAMTRLPGTMSRGC